MSLAVISWLGLCSWYDWKRREVPNLMTLPALAIALVLRLSGLAEGAWQMSLGIAVVFLFGWLLKIGIGGADAKVSIALALFSPQMVVWAWMGVILWYLIVKVITLGKQGPYRLPGMVGFLVGVLLMEYVTFLRGAHGAL